jgi:hypothetical protein
MARYEIIVHLWAKQLPQYAAFAAYQISSLLRNPPERCQVQYTVCYCPEDAAARSVLDAFDERAWPTTVALKRYPMNHGDLCRRGIGRDRLARVTTADVVYFAGIDYQWGPGALYALIQASLNNPDAIVYPGTVLTNQTHAMGDAAVQRAFRRPWGEILENDPAEFVPTRIPRPIGCLQVIAGDVARSKGYLPPHSRFLRPASRWMRTFEDRVARSYLGLRYEAAMVPNLYRMRHSKQGRFVDLRGQSIK